jgi:hypothetical protein
VTGLVEHLSSGLPEAGCAFRMLKTSNEQCRQAKDKVFSSLSALTNEKERNYRSEPSLDASEKESRHPTKGFVALFIRTF